MNLSIVIFPDSYEVQVPYTTSGVAPTAHLTGKLCIITSRAVECQSIELELRGDLLVDHKTSFDVLNNLMEGMPPPVVHIHHEVELPLRRFEVGHNIVEFSMPLSKKMPPSYQGIYVVSVYPMTVGLVRQLCGRGVLGNVPYRFFLFSAHGVQSMRQDAVP
jgi:hypothetical protein